MYGCTLLIRYLCHYRQYKEIKVKLEEKFNPTNLLKRAGNEMSNLDFVLWNLSREPTPTTHKPQPPLPVDSMATAMFTITDILRIMQVTCQV